MANKKTKKVVFSLQDINELAKREDRLKELRNSLNEAGNKRIIEDLAYINGESKQQDIFDVKEEIKVKKKIRPRINLALEYTKTLSKK